MDILMWNLEREEILWIPEIRGVTLLIGEEFGKAKKTKK